MTGAAAWSQLPPPSAAEIAFAGRSNAGKSSAINALARRAKLAFSSRTPGRTQQINFFRLKSGAFAVDLPGYGYAAVSHKTKEEWQAFLWRYVTERATLTALVLLVDARRGITALDAPLIDVFVQSSRPVLILATKSDKLNRQEQTRAIHAIRADLRRQYSELAETISVVLFSAVSKTGVDEADNIILSWIG